MSLRALSNGKISRPSYFKYQKGVAEILNLVINVNDGKVESLVWKNQCINKVCEFENCKMTEFQVGDSIEKETNCYIKTCQSSSENNNCDTKVYVTWVGFDSTNRYFESDNYRITHFIEHSIISYWESAISIAS